MSDILFVTWDGGGNVPPATAIATELVSRGHTVAFLGHATQRTSLESAGFEVLPVRHARPFDSQVTNSALTMMATFGDSGLGQDLLDALDRRRFDLVVVDCLMVGALAAAHRSGVRYAVLEHMYDAYYRRVILAGPMGLNLRLRRLRPQAALDGAALRLVTTVPELDPLPSSIGNARQVGPVVPLAPRTVAVATSDPTVLVTLSTYGYPGMQQALQNILDASRDIAARFVVTTGPVVDPARLDVPSGVEVHRFVPHSELMPGVSLVVGHGGHGTTMQALGHDVPLLVMPMGNLADQPLVGRSIEAAGAGRMLRKKSSPALIAPVIRELLAEGPHRAAAAGLGATIRRLRGAELGADALEELVEDGARAAGA